jgi:hypothetical protein
VDIVQNCEVTGVLREGGHVTGVRTTRGTIHAPRVGIAAAGHASVVAAMAGLELPIQSHPLQALVSEPVKPIHPCVVMSNAVHVYVSQSDKGELVIGAGIDAFNSYSQRGSFHVIENQMSALIELFPIVSRLRLLRTWAGIVDVCPDASPIICENAGDRACTSTAAGAPAASRRRRARAGCSRTPSRRRAASAQRALRARSLHERRPDRRARRRGRGALMLIDPVPLVRRARRGRVLVRRPGAHRIPEGSCSAVG